MNITLKIGFEQYPISQGLIVIKKLSFHYKLMDIIRSHLRFASMPSNKSFSIFPGLGSGQARM